MGKERTLTKTPVEMGNRVVITKGHFINKAGKVDAIGKLGCGVILDGDTGFTFFYHDEVEREGKKE